MSRNTPPGFKSQRFKPQDFIQLNFEGIKDLNVHQCFQLIDHIYNQVKLPTPASCKINSVLPEPLDQFLWSKDFVMVRCGFDHVYNVFKATEFDFPDPEISDLPVKSGKLDYCDLTPTQTIKSSFHLKDILLQFMPDTSFQVLQEMQHTTAWILRIITTLKTKSCPPYILQEGILVRQTKTAKQVKLQIVLPDCMTKMFLFDIHHNTGLKHINMAQCQRLIESYFYIKNFKNIFSDIVKNCKFCQLNNTYPNKKLNFSSLKVFINQPSAFLHLDICILRESKICPAFLTIVDIFTGYSQFIPCPSAPTTEQIIDLLMSRWISVFSHPICITSDNASYFSSQLLGEVATLLKIKLFKIAPLHSQSNFSERVHKYALNIFRIYLQNYEITDKNFPMLCSLVSVSHNQLPSLVSGHSPYYLMFATPPKVNNFTILAKCTKQGTTN